jgi:hypothetical protein
MEDQKKKTGKMFDKANPKKGNKGQGKKKGTVDPKGNKGGGVKK